MGKVYADHTQAQTQEPVIVNPKTVDTYHDAAMLPATSLSQGDNIILDDGMIEKVLGTTKANADATTSAYGVMGLHRTYSRSGTKACLRLWNGTLKAGPSAFATTVLASLAANKRTPWIDIRGKAYGINETDGIIRYDGDTAIGIRTGVVGPFLRKKIAFFEDDETWTSLSGGAKSTSVARPEEWTGKTFTSLRLNCSAASTTATSRRTVPLCLSAFSDGKAVDTDQDYISFHTFHGTRNNLSAVTLTFMTGGVDFTHSFKASLDGAFFEDGDHEWTKWNIRLGAFSTLSGTPAWGKVSAVRLEAKSNTLGPTVVHFDYMYLKPSPIKPHEMNRRLFNVESPGQETWSFIHGAFDTKEKYEGTRSIKLTGDGTPFSATCILSNAVDLTKWPNGVDINSSDEMVFHIRQDTAPSFAATNPFQIRVGSHLSSYYTRSYAALSAFPLTAKNQWYEFRVPKYRLSAAVGGTPDWTRIKHIAFVGNNMLNGKKAWIDDCYLEQKVDSKQIATFEASEQDNCTIVGKGEFAVDPQGKGKVTEGEYSLQLYPSKAGSWSESSCVYDCETDTGGVLNLALWADGGNSDTNDVISFSLFHQKIAKIEWVEIWFDNDSAQSFAKAYKYRITKDMFAGGGTKNNMGKEIQIQKKDFEEVDSGGSWATIGAMKIISYAKGGKNNASVYVDNVRLTRKTGQTGRYYYKYIFKMGDVASAASEDSDHIDVKSSMVSLVNISTSQDSRVTSREIYRLGGAYPDTWSLVKVIEDNTTTEIVDDLDDDEITYFLGDEVPLGWVNSVLGNNLIYDAYSDRALYWGDPSFKNRVYFSHQGFYHVVDEWGYREFPDDVLNVVPWFGQNIIFYKHAIQKITGGDITTGQLIDVPAEMGACSYWAVGKAWNGMIPFVGQDNVYLFDGIRVIPIGNDVKGYFMSRGSYLSTVIMGIVKDTLYIACRAKTGTPTYNNVVLRCYLPTKAWTVLPNWNVNMWSNWDKQDDANEMYYGDSVNGDIYSINSTGYQFGTTNIGSTVGTGWFSKPDADIAIQRIEFKAKGTAASTITFNGYKNLVETPATTGTVTLTTTWQTFRIGPKGLMELLRGDCVKLEFTQASQNAYFKIRDVVVYAEKLSERVSITTANEVTVAAP